MQMKFRILFCVHPPVCLPWCMHRLHVLFCSVLFHYPTRDPQERQSLIQQGVTIFISQLNDLNAEKIQPSGYLNPGHVQFRYTPQEPHTNRDEIPFCILPYLNISDFLWFKVYMHACCLDSSHCQAGCIKLAQVILKIVTPWPSLLYRSLVVLCMQQDNNIIVEKHL